jgi:putative ABC transport system ATP-binding protein
VELVIIVKDLVKVYRLEAVEVQALRGLTVKIEEGELVSIVGPSGSGKTTLLNIVGGLSKATAGSVMVGDIAVTSLDETQLIEYRRKTVGHIFQTMNLIPTLTAAENVELPMMALKVPREERAKRVNFLLKEVGLKERINHKPGELSGGEQQRVAIAAALSNDPPIILADEPTGELDTVNSKNVVDYLLKINQEMGKTILMVTHDPIVARVGDRILRIEDGVIGVASTPTQITEEEKAVSFIDQIRIRIDTLNNNLRKIEENLKNGKISGEDYFKQRQSLIQTISVYKEELHRMGVV